MKTIKELSEQLKVTPQSVRNEIAKQAIQTKQSKGGRGFLLSDEDAERIISAFSERRTGTKQSKTMQRNKQENDLLLFLQREIETKNRQIERLQDENAALTAALQTTTESLQIAQRLHAGTMQERLETKEDETILEPQQETTQDESAAETESRRDLDEQEPPKKSFWQRIFGKR